MNNSVFGKTMENLRKRVNVELVTDKDKYLKLVSQPSFVNSKIFDSNLTAVHRIKEALVLNKPIYLGMIILDRSKTLMYDFHYNYVKKRYGDRSRLLFTDTDSLMYQVDTEDVYKDLEENKELFDNSEYPKDSPYYDATNAKALGK